MKLNDFSKHIMDIKVSVGKIEQHLKDLNGTVTRHQKEINKNESAITKTNYKIAYGTGALAVLIVFAEVLVKNLFLLFGAII